MTKATPFIDIEPVTSPQDALTEILRAGAQRMLAAALEAEVSPTRTSTRAPGTRLVAGLSCATATVRNARSRPGSEGSKSDDPASTIDGSTSPVDACSSRARSCRRTCGARSPSRS